MPVAPVTPVISCFFTTVKSLLTVPHSFGFLGEHGKRLGAREQYTVPGNLIDALGARGVGQEGSMRQFKALERAVAGFTGRNGVVHPPTLAVLSTPAVHLYDTVSHLTHTLRSNNSVLGAVDPCWGAFSSS